MGGFYGKGIYLKVSADATTGVPLSLSAAEYPTLVGTRIVGAVGAQYTALQDPSSIGSNTFNNWIDSDVANPASPFYGLSLTRSDVAATGNLVAQELRDGTFYTQKIDISKWAGLGNPTLVNDCQLPASGLPSQPSFSQDGTQLTWHDNRGVVIAGSPTLQPGGPFICDMPAARVISATGIYPSYGPFNVPVPVPAAPPAPKVKVDSKISLSKALKSGFSVTVTSTTAGKAKITLTIKPSKVGKKGKKAITLATGSATVKAGKATKIKVKFTKAGKKLKKKLKGKKATLSVTVAGGTATTKTVKFK